MNNKPVRVLLVSPYSAKRVGGIGTWSKIILDYSKSCNDCDIRFLNTVQGLPKRWSMNNRIAHLLVGFLDSILIVIRLFFRMLVDRPDVVHYTSSAGSALRKDLIAIWIVKKVFHKRFVIHWHFGRIPAIFEEKGNEYRLFVKVCDRCDVSIPIDNSSYNVLRDENIKSVCIPNPIPVLLQREAESIHPTVLQNNRMEGVVLFVGHVLKGKGIFELVKACTDCERVKRLIVVGPFFDEQLKNELIAIAKKRNDSKWVEFVGEKSREEVWGYYKTCSLFCLPSYSEGFPYVVLEAMAFACPIVATKVGAIPEMLSDGCGELIDAQEVESLKDALTHLLRDKEDASISGVNAHNKVLNNYTIDKVFDQYLEVWKSNKS